MLLNLNTRYSKETWQLHADAGLAEGGGALVISRATGKAVKDWRDGGQLLSLYRVPIGPDTHAKKLISENLRPD